MLCDDSGIFRIPSTQCFWSKLDRTFRTNEMKNNWLDKLQWQVDGLEPLQRFSVKRMHGLPAEMVRRGTRQSQILYPTTPGITHDSSLLEALVDGLFPVFPTL